MLVLHGGWIPTHDGQAGRFALWGEVGRGHRRRPDAARPLATGRARRGPAVRARRHPFSARCDQLAEALVSGPSAAAAEPATPDDVLFRLPSTATRPLPSPQLPVDAEPAGTAPVGLAVWR